MKKTMSIFRRIFFLALSVCLTLLLMLDKNPLNAPPNTDSGIFLYIGSQILRGYLPYNHVWDHKGPLIYYLDALGLWMGHNSVWGVWLLESIFLTISLFLFLEIIYRFGGVLPAVVGILVGFYFLNKFFLGNLTEEYYFFFSSMAIFLYLFREDNKNIHFLIIGIMSICGFLLRPNNIGIPVAIVFSMLVLNIRRRSLSLFIRQILWLLVGLFGVLLFVGIYFWINHALGDLIDQVFIFNIAYSKYYHSVSTESFLLRNPLLFRLLFISYLIIFFFSAFTSLVKSSYGKIITLLLIGLPLEISLISISGRGFDHYLIALQPYLILASGLVLSLLLKILPVTGNNQFNFAVSIGLIVLFLLPNFKSLNKYIDIFDRLAYHRENGIESVPLVDRYIKENTLKSDKVLVWGHGGSINFLSKRDTPTLYLYQTGSLFTPGYTTPEMSKKFLYQLMDAPPELVVVFYGDLTSPFLLKANTTYQGYLPPLYMDIASFFQEKYHLEVDLQSVFKKIYRLNSSVFVPQ